MRTVNFWVNSIGTGYGATQADGAEQSVYGETCGGGYGSVGITQDGYGDADARAGNGAGWLAMHEMIPLIQGHYDER